MLKRQPLLWLMLSAWLVTAAEAAETVHHAMAVRLDPAKGTIQIRDRITLPAGAPARFTLHAGFAPQSPGYAIEPVAGGGAASGLRDYRVVLPEGVRSFELTYAGRWPGSDGEESAAATDNVVLHPASGWYADFEERPVQFELRLTLPQGWQAVSQGESEWRTPTAEQRWRSDTPQQGIYLVAAPFHRYQRDSVWGRAEVYLRSEDQDLAREYLDATVQYLGLFSRLIGTYAYPKFALVENTAQTGYGMPSFTLLGSRVIRLPFIVHTSYPHEILHNWWGNGVWVAYEGGNWAEALTTYLADYLLAEQRGRGMAQRRAALQKYADFVADHNDFPLRHFRARHGEASQAIGYSKGMMFFHMLRLRLGDEGFVAGLRNFYRAYRFRHASFDDLRAVFAQVGGDDLETFFAQWVGRPGAPELALGATEVTPVDGRYRIRGTLQQRQAGPPYRLEVPVAVQVAGRKTALLHTVVLHAREQGFELTVPARPLRLAVDPEFDLFRRLDVGELPPSLGRLQGAGQAVYVLPGAAPAAMIDAYRQLARTWARPGDRIVTDNELEGVPAAEAVWLLGRENRLLPQLQKQARNLPMNLDRQQLSVAERRLPLDQHSIALALTGAAPDTSWAWVAAPSVPAVADLARKLPHYSRYGYLAFATPETRNVVKGEWPVTDSPLQRALVEDAPALRLPARAPLSALLGPGVHAPP